MQEKYYVLKTSNDKYFVGARRLIDRVRGLEDVYFDDDPNTVMEINNKNTAQTIADKYGFIVYKVTVTTEMEKESNEKN
ncbi:hypothetical protein [Ligilactobacillus saerimneri]|uniref:Uncharacterized protein n=1 Tax=Ligilactobacillus saerimneri 30a TaxID=1227363 RepID=M5J772_9LACO|nr:hypothetical protein [Ligilactobacillus saerimneri]EKW99397.1 hypothetical protein D271_02419 [Ligilactobacillus saerimneri 30a]